MSEWVGANSIPVNARKYTKYYEDLTDSVQDIINYILGKQIVNVKMSNIKSIIRKTFASEDEEKEPDGNDGLLKKIFVPAARAAGSLFRRKKPAEPDKKIIVEHDKRFDILNQYTNYGNWTRKAKDAQGRNDISGPTDTAWRNPYGYPGILPGGAGEQSEIRETDIDIGNGQDAVPEETVSYLKPIGPESKSEYTAYLITSGPPYESLRCDPSDNIDELFKDGREPQVHKAPSDLHTYVKDPKEYIRIKRHKTSGRLTPKIYLKKKPEIEKKWPGKKKGKKRKPGKRKASGKQS